MKLEVVIIGVSDVDRAKAFYQKLGWRLDADFSSGDDYRILQLTPHNSEASIIFGKGVTSAKPGLAEGLTLAVDDIDVARDDVITRVVKVSEVFHYAGGPFNIAAKNPRVNGRDPQVVPTTLTCHSKIRMETAGCFRRLKLGFPAANGKSMRVQTTHVATLAELLHETAQHHDHFEKTHGKHQSWDWYAPYLSARQNGTSPDDAAAAADRYTKEVHQI